MLTHVSYILTAPSEAPNLKVVEIHHSQVKLHWDEIPLEQRNGIIQGYTIYFWDDSNITQGIQGFKEVENRFSDNYLINHNVSILFQVINTEETNVVVENLQPITKYHALVSIFTTGGSVNGSVENLTTGHIGEYL